MFMNERNCAFSSNHLKDFYKIFAEMVWEISLRIPQYLVVALMPIHNNRIIAICIVTITAIIK